MTREGTKRDMDVVAHKRILGDNGKVALRRLLNPKPYDLNPKTLVLCGPQHALRALGACLRTDRNTPKCP